MNHDLEKACFGIEPTLFTLQNQSCLHAEHMDTKNEANLIGNIQNELNLLWKTSFYQSSLHILHKPSIFKLKAFALTFQGVFAEVMSWVDFGEWFLTLKCFWGEAQRRLFSHFLGQ